MGRVRVRAARRYGRLRCVVTSLIRLARIGVGRGPTEATQTSSRQLEAALDPAPAYGAGAIGSVTTTDADGSCSRGVRFSGSGEGVQISLRNEGALTPTALIGAPRRIFPGHAPHKLSDLGANARKAGAAPRIRPLARHQLPVPSQQRVRRDDRRDLTQGLPTQPVGPYGESPPVVIGEPQTPPTDLPSEEAILFDQIGERLPLPAIEPTGAGKEQQ